MAKFRENSGRMQVGVGNDRLLAFDDVRFDPGSGALHRASHDDVKLTPRAAAVLVRLIERAPHLLSKEELLAEVWGTKAVTEEALTSCIQELRRALGDDARKPRFIETRHRRGYRWLAATTSRPDHKPSIAVLPFDNIGGDPGDDYFVDGLVEDMTTLLGRVGAFFVMARASSFTLKQKDVTLQEVGRLLSVRYLVTGSVRRAGKKLRLAAQLIEAESGRQLWADIYDVLVEDVFTLQDAVVQSVVGAINPTLRAIEIERARFKRPGSLQAYDWVLRGYPGFWSLTDPAHKEALSSFHRAFELEPSYALAMGLAAWCHAQRYNRVLGVDFESHRTPAIELAQMALDRDGDDPSVLLAAGNALMLADSSRWLDRSMQLIKKALTLDGNSASGWRRMGYQLSRRRQTAEAIAAFERSLQLSPLDPMAAYARQGIGEAHFIAGRLAEALSCFRETVAERPADPYLRHRLCSVLALDGEIEEARRLAREIKAEYPELTIARIESTSFLKDVTARYVEGLRRAGFL